MAGTTMDREQFIEWLRSEFPRLLQIDPRFSAEVVGILSQTLGSRAEFNRLLEEIARLREDAERRFSQLREDMERHFEAAGRRFEAIDRCFDEIFQRFEAADRRFEAIDRRFEEVFRRFEAADRRFEAIERVLAEHGQTLREHAEILKEHTEILREHTDILKEHTVSLQKHEQLLGQQGKDLRVLKIGFGTLGVRLGKGMEEAVRATIEEFAGVGPLQAERLELTDAAGEVFGVPGQVIEFDGFVHNGRRFLVEVKSFAEPEDVAKFFRKLQFAEKRIQQPFERIMVAPFADKRAIDLAETLGIRLLTLEEEEQV